MNIIIKIIPIDQNIKREMVKACLAGVGMDYSATEKIIFNSGQFITLLGKDTRL